MCNHDKRVFFSKLLTGLLKLVESHSIRKAEPGEMEEDLDLALALQIQAEYDEENSQQESLAPIQTSGSSDQNQLSPVDPQWEVLDPSPDVRALFLQFNTRYFWGKLDMVEVRWSPRMTL